MSEQKLREIIDGLFEIAEPCATKNSLWQAYQNAMNDPDRERLDTGDLVQMLRNLPIAVTITKRDANRYAWQWLEAAGEADSLLAALENALVHIEVSFMEANEL